MSFSQYEELNARVHMEQALKGLEQFIHFAVKPSRVMKEELIRRVEEVLDVHTRTRLANELAVEIVETLKDGE